MTGHDKEWAWTIPVRQKISAGIVVLGLFLTGTCAIAETSFSVGSDTIMRLRSTVDEQTVMPAYEYLRLSLTQVGPGGIITFDAGGWGRIDLAEPSSEQRSDSAMQYGYLSFRSKENNQSFTVGRQLVTEGSAVERIDGVSFKSDLVAGFGLSAFYGAEAETVANTKGIQGADRLFGGRVSHVNPELYTLGVSMVNAERGKVALRETVSADLWLHPLKELELVGISSYSTLTEGWMEHDYTLSYLVTDKLTVAADLSAINYRDYFTAATTSALRLKSGTLGTLDPDEKLLVVGGKIAYLPLAALTAEVDYKNYGYDLAGTADYYGGSLTWAPSDTVLTSCAFHRMNGASSALSYDEYRAYITKNIDRLDLSLDFYAVHYDQKKNSISNTYAMTVAAAYEIAEQLRLSADLNYARSPDFDREIKGFVKLTYIFAREGIE